MAWELSSDRPIYAQIMEVIERQIVSGYYPPGARLPSVRELAEEAAVNPNTMQKAFAELERSGLIQTRRTNGRTVTEDETLIGALRGRLAKQHVDAFFTRMRALGYSKSQILELIQNAIADHDGSNENKEK